MNSAKKKSFLVAVVCLILCVALLVGTTFAWFTDSVSNTGNKIQAGTLDIALGQYANTDTGYKWTDISASELPVFDSGEDIDKLWEPGYSQYAVLKVSNNGNLALKYKVKVIKTRETVTQAGDKICDVIDVYAAKSFTASDAELTAEQVKTALDEGQIQKIGTLSDLMADGDGAAYGELYPAAEVGGDKHDAAYAVIVLKMQESAGNEYQNLSADFDIRVEATQLAYEKDGFGSDQYDANANGIPDHQEFEIASVPVVTNQLVIPVVVEDNKTVVDSSKTEAERTITNSGLSVTYGGGTVLTDGTSVSEDNKTADSEIGFQYVGSETRASGIVVTDNQLAASYDLTLNIEETNTVLNKIVYSNFLKELTGLHVYHDGVEVPTTVSQTDEYYSYDSQNGILTLYVKHASYVEFVYDMPTIGGKGTKEDPYIVGSVDELRAVKDLTGTQKIYVKLNSDIDFTGVPAELAGYGYRKNYGYALGNLKNAEIDGQGHTVKVDEGEGFIGYVNNTEVKNLNVVFVNNKEQSVIGDMVNSKLTAVTAGGLLTFTGNCGVFVTYTGGNCILDSCVNNVNITGTGYNGIFVGYDIYGTLELNNCINNGNATTGYQTFVMGNMAYGEKTVKINNLINNGNVRWTNTTNYVFNPILGATSDKYNQLTVICDGTTYAGLDKYKNIVFAGTGSFVNGPNDTGMQITVNDNKTFTFTKSSFSNVDHYYVQIYTYVGKADGSGRAAVDETIAATEAGSYTTELLDLGFADGTDVTKQVAGHDVLTVGGKDYYRNTIENSWISGGKTEDTIINIYAYDAAGYVVSSVVLNRSGRW